ncbi:MAG: hypothetical protein OHK0019_37250 [Saprospiraceae bacterium]
MKQSFLLLALLFFILGCKKYEAEYAVSCQFPASFFFSKRILPVTNPEGEVLHKFDILEGASSFS